MDFSFSIKKRIKKNNSSLLKNTLITRIINVPLLTRFLNFLINFYYLFFFCLQHFFSYFVVFCLKLFWLRLILLEVFKDLGNYLLQILTAWICYTADRWGPLPCQEAPSKGNRSPPPQEMHWIFRLHILNVGCLVKLSQTALPQLSIQGSKQQVTAELWDFLQYSLTPCYRNYQHENSSFSPAYSYFLK